MILEVTILEHTVKQRMKGVAGLVNKWLQNDHAAKQRMSARACYSLPSRIPQQHLGTYLSVSPRSDLALSKCSQYNQLLLWLTHRRFHPRFMISTLSYKNFSARQNELHLWSITHSTPSSYRGTVQMPDLALLSSFCPTCLFFAMLTIHRLSNLAILLCASSKASTFCSTSLWSV
jgi:hypothetical protein